MHYIIKNEVEFPSDGIHAPKMEKLIKGLLAKNIVSRVGCGKMVLKMSKPTRHMKTLTGLHSIINPSKHKEAETVGADGIVETTEEYDSYETYMANTMPYAGDQKWCATW